MESSRSWSIDSYLNEHFDIPAKNPPSEARLRWRRAVGLVVRNRRRRFRMFSGLHALDDAQRRKILRFQKVYMTMPLKRFCSVRGTTVTAFSH
ncbi:probable calcium-transporting ATPase 6, plasma membrane-type [Miscanthus floridulus]|uniref:probable calcium-transporting ATPase 6, plasma membrane-type n=1 Tax=Miscanthus floridulus TaxID=154761 RepID=UPI003459D9C5